MANSVTAESVPPTLSRFHLAACLRSAPPLAARHSSCLSDERTMKPNTKGAQVITVEPISVEMIEIDAGTIESLRAYFGWRAGMAFDGEGGPRAGWGQGRSSEFQPAGHVRHCLT
jgi:hypothetical protein